MKQFFFVALILAPSLAFGAGRKKNCNHLLNSTPAERPFEFVVTQEGTRTEISISVPDPRDIDSTRTLAELDFIKLGSAIFDFYLDRGSGTQGRQDFTEALLNRLFYEHPDVNQIRTTMLGDDLEGFLDGLSKNSTPAVALAETPLARALARRGFSDIQVLSFFTDDNDPMGTLHVEVDFKKASFAKRRASEHPLLRRKKGLDRKT